MSDIESIITLEYHNNRYTVANIIHSGTSLPIVLDREIYKIVKSLKKKWYINDKNHIYCFHNNGKDTYQVYLHDIVIKLSKDIEYQQGVPIVHINKIHFDNRLENLQFDVPNKDYSKNIKKKKRTIDLSEHNINVNDLPTYLWYLKPDQTHGERFVVDIPNELSWRSTASKKVSLRYKLEEAKKFLRHTKQVRPDIFEKYSMNGDLTSKGFQLYKEYHTMIQKAGFTMNKPDINNTDHALIEDMSGLTNFEAYLLYTFNPDEGTVDIGQTYKEYDAIVNIDK